MGILGIGTPSVPSIVHEELVVTLAPTTVEAKEEQPKATTTPVAAPVIPDTLKRISWCESRNILTAKNPNSTATGKYQFLKGSWEYYGKKLWGTLEGKSIFSEKDQDELALYVVSINGFKDWDASKHCWSK